MELDKDYIKFKVEKYLKIYIPVMNKIFNKEETIETAMSKYDNKTFNAAAYEDILKILLSK